MASPFDFNTGDILTAAELNEIGETKNWTPSWEFLTIGNAGVSAKYNVVNNLCFYWVLIAFGSTTSFSGNARLTAPINNALNSYQNGQAWWRPTGGTIYKGHTTVINNKIYPYAELPVSAGGYVRSINVNGGIPATWTTSGIMYMNGAYQVA